MITDYDVLLHFLGAEHPQQNRDTKRRKWTFDEDTYLMQNAKISTWRDIARHLSDRTDDACRNRWMRISAVKHKPTRKHTKKRERWTVDEDRLLIMYYNMYGPKWKKIAHNMPNRNAHSIRSRRCRISFRDFEAK